MPGGRVVDVAMLMLRDLKVDDERLNGGVK